MKCIACNKTLSDFEATRKVSREDGTSDYPDLCNKCFNISGIGDITEVVERSDLQHEEDVTEGYDDEVQGNIYSTSWDEDDEE